MKKYSDSTLMRMTKAELIERSPNGRHLCMRKVIRERVQLTDFCSHAVLIVRGENESR